MGDIILLPTFAEENNKSENMPTIFFFFGLRFFFFTNEHLPPHIHVRSADGKAKFNLLDGTMMEESTLKPKDLKKAKEVMQEKRGEFLQEWYNIHGE